MLGLSFASRHSPAVSKLVLVGCGTYDKVARARMRDSIQQRLGPERRQRIVELEAKLVGETSPVQREAALQQIGTIRSDLETYCPVGNEADQSGLLPLDPDGHTETWNDVIRLQDAGIEPQTFSQICAPVLMIHGDHDPHPGTATRDLLRRYIPHLEYLNLDRCGHEPWREQYARESFAATLCDWLERK
jgi:pimeloyl-ACP methyl ester carboxylesterase